MKERQKDSFIETMEGEKIVEMELERLKAFERNPFIVTLDSDMRELIESIRQYGILTPLIVRPMLDGNYEIISGHRRKFAAEQLGFNKVPVVIRMLEDEDSVICMVDSNLRRERIKTSEKAFAYRMKHDALKRKTGRPSKYEIGIADSRIKYKKTVEVLSTAEGDSARQIGRYIRLTYLIPELLKLVDEGRMGFNPAVTISFLKEKEQKDCLDAMEYTQSVPSLSQAQRLKRISSEGRFTKEKAIRILEEIKKGEIHRVSFKNEQLYRFFPKYYTPEQMRKKILEILADYKEKKEGETVCVK